MDNDLRLKVAFANVRKLLFYQNLQYIQSRICDTITLWMRKI